MDRHLGYKINGWVSAEARQRLEELAESSGRRKTAVLESLIMGRRLPEKSYLQTLNVLAKLGGLLKFSVQSNRQDQIYALGCEIVKIARELRAEATRDADSDSEENGGSES